MSKFKLNTRLGFLSFVFIGFLLGFFTLEFLSNRLNVADASLPIKESTERKRVNNENISNQSLTRSPSHNHVDITMLTGESYFPEEFVEADAKLMNIDSPKKKQITFREQQKFRVRLRTNPEERKQALARYFNSTDPDLIARLGAALAQSNDHEIEVTAVRFALEGSTSQQRITALDLLSQLQNLDQNTRAALSDMLNTEASADEQLTIATLTALTPRGFVSESEQAGLINIIKPFSADPNPRIREQGLRTLAEWAPNDPAVVEAVAQATQDLEPSVRSAAVQTLGQPNFRFNDVRDTILASLEDVHEDFNVRLTAWRALENFPLDAQTYQSYSDFRKTFPTETDTSN